MFKSTYLKIIASNAHCRVKQIIHIKKINSHGTEIYTCNKSKNGRIDLINQAELIERYNH